MRLRDNVKLLLQVHLHQRCNTVVNPPRVILQILGRVTFVYFDSPITRDKADPGVRPFSSAAPVSWRDCQGRWRRRPSEGLGLSFEVGRLRVYPGLTRTGERAEPSCGINRTFGRGDRHVVNNSRGGPWRQPRGMRV
ncbi:hypothetical protein CSUI_003797 [Cystoisospora suis]|uniref:Uncharacterized protein n=1 Tax=Cystoisospora suis TaxID=483139 RepID=A0A2C6KPD3_9APIC|nr:hypothetical protein CSUI_003797 [Cystoisospora suis]